ncbi:MAG: hypothetical protein NC102_00120 [Clostridium sp.]|nr:hypothetical protein [Clostridium sp.]
MKAFFATILIIPIAFAAAAQEHTDSLSAKNLHEVVIQAPRVIHKADMDVYYPSKSAVDNSKNGVQLLNNLMIPSLTVIDALGTIQAAGEAVQVRINGRQASIDQVRALLPETIKRVEWIDNPGLRFNGANYVLNFIVANPTVGGSLQTEVEPALNTPWGYAWADLKLNSGRSQWKIGGNFKYSNKLKSHREYTETFTFPDGQTLTRNETSRGGYLDNTMGRAWIEYSYIKPDTTIFFAGINDYHTFRNRTHYDGLMEYSNSDDDLLLTDQTGSNGNNPQFSAYLEQHFPHRQTLVVDFRTLLYFGKSYSDYMEQQPGTADYLTDVHTLIKDRNQAYAIEANYIKSWDNSRFTAGALYSANRNRSVYENLGGEVFHQRQDKAYFFAEYFRRVKKFTFTAGLGAQYTSFHFKESNQGNSSWNVRPQATLTYGINQRHSFRLSFESWQSTPSLAETNVAPQQLDGFQWRIGNPNLKTSNSYMLTLRYNFGVPRVSGQFGIRAFTSPNAITPLLKWEDDRLVTTYENSRGLKNLTFFFAPQIEVIPRWLMLSGYIQYRMENMRGTGYDYNGYNWSGNATVRATHWGFTLMFQYAKARRDLWGEKISWGEDVNVIDLSYNWKNWQFGAGMIMPFGRYDHGSKMISKWNTNEQHMRLDMRMPYVKISYNVRWGHQKRGASKLINADANVDASTAGGR